MHYDIEHGTVVRSPLQGSLHSCCIPRVEVLDSGRWIVGFRASTAKQNETQQRVCVTWSDDWGQSWSEPVTPFNPPMIKDRPGRFRAIAFENLHGQRVLATLLWQDVGDEDLPFFNSKTEGVQDMRIFFSISSDNGSTWSPLQRVVEKNYEHVPVSITGPILLLRDGTWLCQFETNKPYNDENPWQQAAVAGRSIDQGQSWSPAAVVAHDRANRIMYWDQRPQVMEDGSLLNFFWTLDKGIGSYINIHVVRSSDGGINWSAPFDTGVPGQPAPPVDLGNGRVAMVYVDRQGPPKIKIRLSENGGRSFDPATEALIHERASGMQTILKTPGTSADAWAEMEAFSIGLPDAVRMPDNTILVVFYSGSDRDHTDLHWARVFGVHSAARTGVEKVDGAAN